MQTNQKILDNLPKKFSRRELLSATVAAGYSQSKAAQIIELAELTGEVERIERGYYRKVGND